MDRSFRGRSIVSAFDLSAEEIWRVFGLTSILKHRYYSGERVIELLKGKGLGLIFQKPSTRTRVSLELAMRQLGGYAIYMGWNELQLGRGESIGDTARVLSRYFDGLALRVYSHEILVEMARVASIPIINALSDLEHPLQAYTDFFTIYEKKRRLEGIKIAFLGDGGDNVLNSLIAVASMLGANIYVATPPGYYPSKEILEKAYRASELTGSIIEITDDPITASKDADVIYTDVWISIGREAEREKRIKDLEPYRVTKRIMSTAKKDAIFMHCLPARRGEEVEDEVIDGPQSVVWDQAENRLHVQKAILSLVI
ncbi:MAG: ornithine carbamoyltransferase [Desulfurococcales archaeon]|nr:ornithine carbamoyltransferase [Desulfurococcales archaeon]